MQTAEEVIEALTQMVQIEQRVLAEIIANCYELFDFEALRDTVLNRYKVNALTLLNLTLSTRVIKFSVEEEIAKTEARLKEA